MSIGWIICPLFLFLSVISPKFIKNRGALLGYNSWQICWMKWRALKLNVCEPDVVLFRLFQVSSCEEKNLCSAGQFCIGFIWRHLGEWRHGGYHCDCQHRRERTTLKRYQVLCFLKETSHTKCLLSSYCFAYLSRNNIFLSALALQARKRRYKTVRKPKPGSDFAMLHHPLVWKLYIVWKDLYL